MDAARHLEIRKPVDELEDRLVRRALCKAGSTPGRSRGVALPDEELRRFWTLRYALSFARMTVVRALDGTDVEVADFLARHRWRVVEALRPRLEQRNDRDRPLADALALADELGQATREERARLLDSLPLDRDSLEAEVTTRQLVVVAGGGGGSGYGYPGAYHLLNRRNLQPELIAGTSIGALTGMFRVRRRIFDPAPMVEAARRLNFNTVLRALDVESRYGLPATLRLYLRSALGDLFLTPDGRPMTFEDVEIPFLVVATGITVDALKHDLSYYEHFLDDALLPGRIFRASRIQRLRRLVGVIREFVGEPDKLREVVFGADPLTRQADILDAAGFSAAVPGLIHYDVLRDDQRMKHLLDRMYGEFGITRLTEGGLVNNLPARPAYAEVMKGRLGRRNLFVLAMDCFSPRPTRPAWYPIQLLVRPNVRANLPYAHLYFPLTRRLSPLNLVPNIDEVTRAMHWTAMELERHVPYLRAMCDPLPVLGRE